MLTLVVEQNIAPLARHTLADQVYRDLRDLILSGRIEPGEKLTLRRLAAVVGTSPMPVRDAASRLVAEKALVMLPSRTLQVPWPSASEFAEIVTIRCALEGLAAELAAQRRSDADVDALRRHAVAFDLNASAASPNPLAAIEHNRHLHFTVYKASGLPKLVQMIEGLWLQVGPVLYAAISAEILGSAGSGPRLTTRQRGAVFSDAPAERRILNATHGSHMALVAAIASGDAAAARAALIADIEQAALFIVGSGRLQADP
jgi:DNA-binding GntR family transcriptional regulator